MNTTTLAENTGTKSASADAAATSIERDVLIDVDRDTAWRTIADLGDIQSFHPLVKKSYYHTEQREGVGAARVCEFGGGRSFEEHAIEWHDGEGFTLELRNFKGMPPFKRATATMTVEDADGQTRMSLRIEYTLRYGPLGRLMDRMMVRSQFDKAAAALVKGLKRKLERAAH